MSKAKRNRGVVVRPPPGTPTSLNISTMKRELEAGGGTIGRVRPTAEAAIRKCIRAGYLVPGPERATWVLSQTGRDALDAYNAKFST